MKTRVNLYLVIILLSSFSVIESSLGVFLNKDRIEFKNSSFDQFLERLEVKSAATMITLLQFVKNNMSSSSPLLSNQINNISFSDVMFSHADDLQEMLRYFEEDKKPLSQKLSLVSQALIHYHLIDQKRYWSQR
ncbi:hypothetical protein HYV11_01235 [Candidatus Dependentiae bacterium]|nr:hypothetical protein [Candidatus Dependentiae bacterium]